MVVESDDMGSWGGGGGCGLGRLVDGPCAEGEEDQREAADEEERVRERLALGLLHVLQRHPGDERDVARDEREDAGAQEAEQSGAEGDEEAELAGGFH